MPGARPVVDHGGSHVGTDTLLLTRETSRTIEARVAEVRRWLPSAEVDHTLRLEPLLRSAFFWLMTPAELADHLDRSAAPHGADR